jgi:Protein of unknown function (DUF3892)
VNDLQVTCVTKRENNHYGISHLGGFGWYWTRQQVIDAMPYTRFYVASYLWGRVYPRVVHSQSGDYVQTFANGTLTDNLLSLPGCYR